MKNALARLKRGDWVFLSISTLLFYLLIRQYVQVEDEMGYALMHPDNNRRVLTLWDAIVSQCSDYYLANGRFIVHTLVQFFCGAAGGYELFYIGSAVFWLLLQIGVVCLCREANESAWNSLDKYLFALFVVFCMPLVGRTYIGHIAYVVNYLWTSALFVWFYLLYSRLKDNKDAKYTWLLGVGCFFYGLVFGSWQESFSIPMAATLGCYYLLHPKRILNQNNCLYLLMIGCLIGFFWNVLAPANFIRIGHNEAAHESTVAYAWPILKRQLWLWIGIAGLLIVAVFDRPKLIASLRRDGFFYGCILFSLLFALFVALTLDHQLVITALCLSIIVIRMILDYASVIRMERLRIGFQVIIAVVLLLMYMPIYTYRNEVQFAWNNYVDAAKRSSDGIVVSDDIHKALSRINSDNYFQRFTCVVYMSGHLRHIEWYEKLLSLWITDGRSDAKVQMTLPKSKAEIVDLGNALPDEGLLQVTDSKCYVLKVNKDACWDKTTFVASYTTKTLGHLKQWLKHIIGRADATPAQFEVPISPIEYNFVQGNYRYIIVNQSPDWYSSFMLKEIK